METGAKNITEALERNINLTEYSKFSETATAEDECSSRLCDSNRMDNNRCQTVESKTADHAGEETNKPKKKNKSEKQKERVRQYKKKIRKAKRQMAAEKQMVEINNIASHLKILQAHGYEIGPPGDDVLPRREVLLVPVSLPVKLADIADIQTVNSPTNLPSDETRNAGHIPDDNITNNDDVFGILSVYVESSMHFEFEDSSDNTKKDDDFGYVYLSISDFLK